MKKLIKSLIVIIITVGIPLLIMYFIIYPKHTKIKIFLNNLNLTKISRNTTLKILTNISQPQPDKKVLGSKNSNFNIEKISEKELSKYKNSGHTLVDVEQYNTQLEIPTVHIKGKVFDGTNSKTLKKGFWHFPLSTGPGTRGNFVVIAHRYDKMPPNTDTFFNLDKVDIGDKIIVTQGKNSWTYIATNSKVVESNDRSVLMQTDDYKITLITCTPLWTAEKRLVVTGKLNQINETI